MLFVELGEESVDYFIVIFAKGIGKKLFFCIDEKNEEEKFNYD